MSALKVCPACAAEYPLSERFCPRDGTALRGPNAQDDLVGSIVAERYHVLSKLGEGGMGIVYLAEHVKMGRKAALKVMNPAMSSNPDAIARFNREAANASRINHPNICGIYDFGETREGLVYLAMEFVDGQSLATLIEKNGSLSAARTASIIGQAAEALSVAHDAGIVHRDLKPDNVMIARARDGGDLVKVVDFGIAKANSGEVPTVTRTGLVVGTPQYMSPEQLAGGKLDGRSDVYSLGLVAFSCLTGLLPFPGDSDQETMMMRLSDQPRTLAEMKPGVAWPAALQSVMDRALARDARARYQKAAEFGRAFAQAVEDMPGAAAEAGTIEMRATHRTDLPRTRMAPRSDAGAAVDERPSARRIPLAAIAAVAIVVAAIWGARVLMRNGRPASIVDRGDSVVGPARGVDSSSRAAAAGGGPPSPTDRSGATATKGAGEPRQGKAPERPPGGGAAPTPAARAERAAAVIAKWDSVLSDTDHPAGDLEARQAVAAVNPLMPKLGGLDRSNALYVEMLAYGLMGDNVLFCAAYQEVLASDPSSIHLRTAAELQLGRNCK